MRLFRKTLLFFIGVIVFQSALTIPLITDFVHRINLSEAQGELEDESSILYDSFNSWKRQIWISLIEIQRGGIAGSPSGSAGLYASPDVTSRSLRELLLSTKVDVIVLKDARAMISAMAQSVPGTFTMTDLEGLANVKSHPYLELSLIRGIFCLVGTAQLGDGEGRRQDVFLLKRVDAAFCSELTLNRRSLVAFFLGRAILSGSISPDMRGPFFNPYRFATSYEESYGQRIGQKRFNVAVQRIGMLGQSTHGDELFFATFLPSDPYDQRILLVSRALLLVTALAALLTILVSLFLTRNITHPFADLLQGMERIRTGAWDTRVPIRGGYEISRLFHGFNEMVRELEHNRAAMHDSMRETLLLKEYNETIVNSIRAGIAIVNCDLVVEKANKWFLESFGLDARKVIGAPLTWLDIDIVDESLVEKVFSIFRRDKDFASEVKRSRTGRVYEVRLYPFFSPEREKSEASGCVFMTDDISAKTELEEKIFHAEKLASISMLSAGMAHEINNPLSSILTNVQNLIDEEKDHERSVSLKWIEQETRRIARIVQELLNFAANDSAHAPGSDVNQVVEDVARMIGRSLARDGRIRVDLRLARGLAPSVVSTDELKQVVINLLTNSVQAIDGEGRVLVCTRMSGQNVSLVVSDSGCGIPKEIIPRIFDPFFTTKGNGEGTGLGLSVVYGIVTKYNGAIEVKSTQERGTRISLNLPSLTGAAS
ncbi:MAG TPA: ATP-binding protein [Spirochaetia bacterium]|nr:ATP-binding protein [Spirochaetia bacterium]